MSQATFLHSHLEIAGIMSTLLWCLIYFLWVHLKQDEESRRKRRRWVLERVVGRWAPVEKEV